MHARITELRSNVLGNPSLFAQDRQTESGDRVPPAWLYVEGRIFHHIRSGRWRAAIPALSTFLEAETLPLLEDSLRSALREALPCRMEFRYELGGRVLFYSPDYEAWGKVFLGLLGASAELILRDRKSMPPL